MNLKSVEKLNDDKSRDSAIGRLHYANKLTSTDLTAKWVHKRKGKRISFWLEKDISYWGVPCFILHSFIKKYWTTQHANTKLYSWRKWSTTNERKTMRKKEHRKAHGTKHNVWIEHFFRQRGNIERDSTCREKANKTYKKKKKKEKKIEHNHLCEKRTWVIRKSCKLYVSLKENQSLQVAFEKRNPRSTYSNQMNLWREREKKN